MQPHVTYGSRLCPYNLLAPKHAQLPATQPKAKEPAAGGKAARFALPADADDEPSQPSVDGANSNGGGSDADTLATAASPLSRTRFAPNAALPSANSDSDKDAGAKRASSVAPSPPGAASNGLLGPPSTLPSVAAHLPSQPMRPFAKIKSMARGAGPAGLPGAAANAAASKDSPLVAAKEAAGGGGGGGGVPVGSHHPVVRLRTGTGMSGDSISRKRLHQVNVLSRRKLGELLSGAFTSCAWKPQHTCAQLCIVLP